MTAELQHPSWCYKVDRCTVRLHVSGDREVWTGEHVGKALQANPAGDEYEGIRAWLVGVPESDGRAIPRSTFVNVEVTQEDVATSYVLPLPQASALAGILLTVATQVWGDLG